MDFNYTILLVEDEPNDADLLKMAFQRNKISGLIQWVRDGLEAIEYLNGKGIYADRARYPFPAVMFLDLKMPRMTGLELLQWLRGNPDFRVIPTIIMSSSRHETDIKKAYELGANTYLLKPSSFDELTRLIRLAHDYWAASVKPNARKALKI